MHTYKMKERYKLKPIFSLCTRLLVRFLWHLKFTKPPCYNWIIYYCTCLYVAVGSSFNLTAFFSISVGDAREGDAGEHEPLEDRQGTSALRVPFFSGRGFCILMLALQSSRMMPNKRILFKDNKSLIPNSSATSKVKGRARLKQARESRIYWFLHLMSLLLTHSWSDQTIPVLFVLYLPRKFI